MARVICIAGNYPNYDEHGLPTGDEEFLVSHGIDEQSGTTVTLPWEHPETLGAKFDVQIHEWVLDGPP